MVLSIFLPGAGQIYNGQAWKALLGWGIFIGGFVFLARPGDLNSMITAMIALYLGMPALWLYLIVDAYRSAESINRKIIGPQKRCQFCKEMIHADATTCPYCRNEQKT
jgi:hypothetical protein